MAKFDTPNDDDDDNGNGRVPSRPRGQLQIVEPRCHVCQSKHRKDVDRYIAMSMSQAEVCRWFEAFDGTIFTRKSMSTHVNKHLGLTTHAVRSIIEDEAREIIGDIENVKGFILTKKAAMRVALQSAYDNIMSGTTLVEPDVMLKIIDKLEVWEREEQEATVDEMKRDFNAFAAAVKLSYDRMAMQLGVKPETLFAELYRDYEAMLANSAMPMVLRGATLELPEMSMPDDIDDADFDSPGGGEDDG